MITVERKLKVYKHLVIGKFKGTTQPTAPSPAHTYEGSFSEFVATREKTSNSDLIEVFKARNKGSYEWTEFTVIVLDVVERVIPSGIDEGKGLDEYLFAEVDGYQPM
jgi:hypothetical protein